MSAELLHFISSHPVDLACIQEFNLNSSSSFRIPGHSALQYDRTHFRSGILSSDDLHASGGVIIFVLQGSSFSDLFLSWLEPYSEYIGINISLSNFSWLSFLNIYAPSICSSLTDSRTEFFSSSILPPPEIYSFWGTKIDITSVSIPLQLFLGSSSTALFAFLNMHLC